MANTSKVILVLIATAMWAIWFQGNKVIFEDCSKNIVDTIVSFTSLVREYNSFAQKIFAPRLRPFPSPSQWSPPESNWVKINLDTHVVNGADRGLGAVCQDAHGALITTGIRRVPATWSTSVSELADALFGFDLAIKLGFFHIYIEGDNAAILKALSSSSHGFSPFYILLDRIRSQMMSFRDVRSSVAAHMVASWNSGSIGDTIYLHPFPQSLVTLCTLDLI